jgi:hypothetical protein
MTANLEPFFADIGKALGAELLRQFKFGPLVGFSYPAGQEQGSHEEDGDI